MFKQAECDTLVWQLVIELFNFPVRQDILLGLNYN